MIQKNGLLGFNVIFCDTDSDLYKMVESEINNVKMRLATALSSELGIQIKESELKCEDCRASGKKMCFECPIYQVCQLGKNQVLKVYKDSPNYPRKKHRIRFSQSKNTPSGLSKIDEIGFKNWIDIKLYQMIK